VSGTNERKFAITPDGGVVHSQPDIGDQPEVRLRHWRVFEFPDGRRFVGDDGYSGRLSTVIETWRPEEALAITASGRRYYLVGPSGYFRDALWLLERWVRFNGVECPIDVTSEYHRG